jgi:hypothetical protein
VDDLERLHRATDRIQELVAERERLRSQVARLEEERDAWRQKAQGLDASLDQERHGGHRRFEIAFAVFGIFTFIALVLTVLFELLDLP